MEELVKRIEQLVKAYSRLEYMIQTFLCLSRDAIAHEDEYITHRDALIKRFEFCYDLTWKTFKQLLKEKYSIDVTSPRKVFHECYQQNMFDRETLEQLLIMIDARNQTSHVYSEEMAEKISREIVGYYEHLKKAVGFLK